MSTSQLLMLIAHLDRMNAALDVALADLLAVEVRVNNLCNEIKTARQIVSDATRPPESTPSAIVAPDTLNHTGEHAQRLEHSAKRKQSTSKTKG